MNVLELSSLSLRYGSRVLLENVNMSVQAAQWIAILGRSGCGKSSLLKAIAGLCPQIISAGTIACNCQFAYMAQNDSLLPWLNVLDNVLLAPRLKEKITAQNKAAASELLQKVGLKEQLKQAPYLLSGGQRQRAALARTLMTSADLILMDEPFSALDAITRLELQQLASQLLDNKSVIFITHDPLEAIRLADKIYVIANNKIDKVFIPQNARPRFAASDAQPQLQTKLIEALM